MARSSRADAARHHDELIRAASRLFRERGVGAVSVPDVMGEIGLTRGGFHKHFESKEALVTAAVDATFTEHVERIRDMAEDNAHDPDRTRDAFVGFCLSADNRDDPAHGCPASLATAMGYTEHEGTPREAFVAGTRAVLDELADNATGVDPDPEDTRRRNLVDLSTVVGAILLSRATAGDPISDEILAAAHHAVGRARD